MVSIRWYWESLQGLLGGPGAMATIYRGSELPKVGPTHILYALNWSNLRTMSHSVRRVGHVDARDGPFFILCT